MKLIREKTTSYRGSASLRLFVAPQHGRACPHSIAETATRRAQAVTRKVSMRGCPTSASPVTLLSMITRLSPGAFGCVIRRVAGLWRSCAPPIFSIYRGTPPLRDLTFREEENQNERFRSRGYSLG
jgi:hypothetical protein